MKLCAGCKIEKPVEAYTRDGRRPDGLNIRCIPCCAAWKKKPDTAAARIIAAPKLNTHNVDKALLQSIEARMEVYKCDALDAIHDLAMMEISSNSYQNQIKFQAACKIVGTLPGEGNASPANAGEFEKEMARLNKMFHETAPRIKQIRERTVTFEDTQPVLPAIEVSEQP